MSDSEIVAMTEEKRQKDAVRATGSQSPDDTPMALTVSSYLDGTLIGQDLKDFEQRLAQDADLARAIAEMHRIERQLASIGSAILSEPIPPRLLKILPDTSRD